MPVQTIDGIPLLWPDEENLFPAEHFTRTPFPAGAFTDNNNSPGPLDNYQNPLNNYTWQSYYMEELIPYLAQKETGKYAVYSRTFTETSKQKIRYPKQKTSLALGSNTPADFGQVFITNGLLDFSYIKTEVFNIYSVISRDGVGLRNYFAMAKERPEDLIFFLEENSGDISNAVMLCKMGEKWRKRFSQKNNLIYSDKEILDAVNIGYGIDMEKFNALIQTGETKGSPWMDTADMAGKALVSSIGLSNYISCAALSKIMEGIISGFEG